MRNSRPTGMLPARELSELLKGSEGTLNFCKHYDEVTLIVRDSNGIERHKQISISLESLLSSKKFIATNFGHYGNNKDIYRDIFSVDVKSLWLQYCDLEEKFFKDVSYIFEDNTVFKYPGGYIKMGPGFFVANNFGGVTISNGGHIEGLSREIEVQILSELQNKEDFNSEVFLIGERLETLIASQS